MKADQYVYIAINENNQDGILKIGKTQHVFDRMGQLSRPTGVCGSYEYIFLYKCDDHVWLESKVHKKFHKERMFPNKEFFKMNLDVAINYIKQFPGEERNLNDIIKYHQINISLPTPKMRRDEISETKIKQIKKLLRHNIKQTDIVKMTKVSKHHVGNIAKELREIILQNEKNMA